MGVSYSATPVLNSEQYGVITIREGASTSHVSDSNNNLVVRVANKSFVAVTVNIITNY